MMVSATTSPSPVESLNGRADRSTVRHVGGDHARAAALGLRAHQLHQLRPLHAVWEAGIVLDFGGDGELAAGRGQRLDHEAAALEHHGREVGAPGVDGGGAAGRATADDSDFHVLRFGHFVLLRQT
jgi:hypothetical protein